MKAIHYLLGTLALFQLISAAGEQSVTEQSTDASTHYWIDGAKGDDRNEGSRDNPWKSIMKLESIAYKPGDVVHVQKGLYAFKGMILFNRIRGAPGKEITIQTEGHVELKALDSRGCTSVVMFSDCHYLRIKGFSITHSGENPVMGFRFWHKPSSHISVDSCKIHDLRNNGISTGVDSSHCLVTNCRFERLPAGMYLGYYESRSKRHYSNYWKIMNNLFVECPAGSRSTGYGIQIKGGSMGNVIQDNVLINSSGIRRASIAVYNISKMNAKNQYHQEHEPNVVRGNFIMNCSGEGIYAAEGALIENNILFNCKRGGIVLSPRSNEWGSYFGRLRVRNNTIFQKEKDCMPAVRIAGEHQGPFIFVNNLMMGAHPETLTLDIPENFKGRCSDNFVYGKCSTAPKGVIRVKDRSVVRSLAFGDQDFLYPTAQLRTDSKLVKHGASLDFNKGIRSKNYVGAYGGYFGPSNRGWRLGKGLKR